MSAMQAKGLDYEPKVKRARTDCGERKEASPLIYAATMQ